MCLHSRATGVAWASTVRCPSIRRISISVSMAQYGSEHFKRPLLSVLVISDKVFHVMINIVVMGRLVTTWEYKLGHSHGVLFMSDSLSSVWGHSVHFSNMLSFSKGYFTQIFVRFLPNFMIHIVVMGKYRIAIVLVIC